MLFFLNQIRAGDIDHDAARGLVLEAKADDGKSRNEEGYKPPSTKEEDISTQPSFVFGFGASKSANKSDGLRADTPMQVLRDPTLLTFILIVFLFHTSNGTVLPLVMQSLAIGNGQSGILMSGLCIIVAQTFMVLSAKVCGTYSAKWGRKTLFLIGFFSVPIRCLILNFLTSLKDGEDSTSTWLQVVFLSTQILDGVGAGIFGTMYVLVTSDISGGTGRFSLTLGLTTAAMSIGGTVSGYLGEALAQDLGYQEAFGILMVMALVPALLYLFCMPETLPALSRKPELQTMESIREEQGSHVPVQSTPAGGKYVEMI